MSLLMDQLLADQQRIRQRRELPAGCDQSGRYPTRTWGDSEQPMAAEACTDEGADDGVSRENGARIGLVLLTISASIVLACVGVVLRYAG